MLVLALDSTAVVATAALLEDEKVLACETVSCGLKHSETLLPLIEKLYQSAGKSFSDTDLYACCVGPGSFTGVRIGVATVKGLAFGGKKCVGVSTLEALAYNLRGFDGIVCPVMDARRGQLYNAIFRWEGENLVRLTPDRVIMIDELAKELEAVAEDIRFCGDGYSLVYEAIRLPQVKETDQDKRDQNGASVAILAIREYEKGNYVTDATIRPTYLRAPQAERERNERLQKEETK